MNLLPAADRATVRFVAATADLFGYSAFEVVQRGEMVTRYVFPTNGSVSREECTAFYDMAERLARRTASAINSRNH